MKKTTKRFKLCLCFFMVFLFAVSCKARTEAAEYQRGRVLNEEPKSKVGKNYFWRNGTKLYVSKSATAKKGTCLGTLFNEKDFNFIDITLGWQYIFTDGTNVIYLSYKDSLYSATIYSVDINGKNRKKITRLKDSDCIVPLKIYNNQLFYYDYSDSSEGILYVYCVSLKTAKVKRLFKVYGLYGFDTDWSASGRYMRVMDNSGDISHWKTLKIFDCKTLKFIKTYKLNQKYGTYFGNDGKYYYFGNNFDWQDEGTLKIYRYPMYGKGSSGLFAKIKGTKVYSISKKYIYFEKHERYSSNYYRYNLSTKKINAISSKELEKATTENYKNPFYD